MRLPAKFTKRLEALERRFGPPSTVMLLVIGNKLRHRSLELEQRPDETPEAFRIRGLRAARAHFPRAESIVWIPLDEEDLPR